MQDDQSVDNQRPTPAPPYKRAPALPVWLIPALLAVLIIGVVLGRLWSTSDDDQNTAAPATSAAPTDAATKVEASVLSVETVRPSQNTNSNTLRADGAIFAKDTANVSAKVSGVAIERVLVDEGSRVKAGQVLAVFDTDAMEQNVLQAKADVAEAKASLTNAQADAARVLPLLDIDAISRQEADRYRTTELRAQASLDAAKARLNTQQLTLKNASVTAPVSGVISDKMIEVGMVAGGEPLFTIIKNGKLEWRADISPDLIGDIKVGTNAKVSLPGDQSVQGRVRRIAPTADNNRQITIYTTLNNHPAARAGMYRTGQFILGDTRVQTVPASAIITDDGYDYVMQVIDTKQTDGITTGRIQKRRIQTGERLGDAVIVTSTLPDEVHLVKQGGSFLNDGDVVRVVNDAQNGKPQNVDAKRAGRDKAAL